MPAGPILCCGSSVDALVACKRAVIDHAHRCRVRPTAGWRARLQRSRQPMFQQVGRDSSRAPWGRTPPPATSPHGQHDMCACGFGHAVFAPDVPMDIEVGDHAAIHELSAARSRAPARMPSTSRFSLTRNRRTRSRGQAARRSASRPLRLRSKAAQRIGPDGRASPSGSITLEWIDARLVREIVRVGRSARHAVATRNDRQRKPPRSIRCSAAEMTLALRSDRSPWAAPCPLTRPCTSARRHDV